MAEEKAPTALQKVGSSPFATVTGPLGFGGLVLFWQLQGINAGQAESVRAQAEMRVELTSLAAKVDSLAANADQRSGQIEALRTEVSGLRSRVDRLEARAEDEKRKR